MMRVDRLETHDRLLEFKKKYLDICQCCQDMINQKPFGNNPFYIFAHTRTIGMDEKLAIYRDDFVKSLQNGSSTGKYKTLADVPEKRLIWQPRLTRPKAQVNSMLFKAYPGTDNIKICWMIPAEEIWGQHKQGNVTEDSITQWSIYQYQHKRAELEASEQDDLSDEQIDKIYQDMCKGAKYQRI